MAIENFVVGKRRSRRPGFQPAAPLTVLAFEDRAALADWLGVPGADVSKLLRVLRDERILIDDPKRGRLTRRVRVERGGRIGHRTMYVIKASGETRARMVARGYCRPEAPPKKPPRGRARRIITW